MNPEQIKEAAEHGETSITLKNDLWSNHMKPSWSTLQKALENHGYIVYATVDLVLQRSNTVISWNHLVDKKSI